MTWVIISEHFPLFPLKYVDSTPQAPYLTQACCRSAWCKCIKKRPLDRYNFSVCRLSDASEATQYCLLALSFENVRQAILDDPWERHCWEDDWRQKFLLWAPCTLAGTTLRACVEQYLLFHLLYSCTFLLLQASPSGRSKHTMRSRDNQSSVIQESGTRYVKVASKPECKSEEKRRGTVQCCTKFLLLLLKAGFGRGATHRWSELHSFCRDKFCAL